MAWADEVQFLVEYLTNGQSAHQQLSAVTEFVHTIGTAFHKLRPDPVTPPHCWGIIKTNLYGTLRQLQVIRPN